MSITQSIRRLLIRAALDDRPHSARTSMRTQRSLLASAALMVTLTLCSASTGPATAATVSASSQTTGLHIGLATPGAPDPHNATFIDDQEGLYQEAQFSNATFYPSGYHWKIDKAFEPHDVAAARTVYEARQQLWLVELAFTKGGANRVCADTTAASHEPQGSPENRVAFFVGDRVVTAPDVLAPACDGVRIAGEFSRDRAHADAVAAAIRRGAGGRVR